MSFSDSFRKHMDPMDFRFLCLACLVVLHQLLTVHVREAGSRLVDEFWESQRLMLDALSNNQVEGEEDGDTALAAVAAAPQRETTATVAPSCECGKANRHQKIVGGQVTFRNEYPWMVSLHGTIDYMFKGPKRSQFCGGSLVATNWVVTAAHCTSEYTSKPHLLTIGLGRHNLAAGLLDSIRLPRIASLVQVHPNYNGRTQDSDVAVVRFLLPVTFGTAVRPICLPPLLPSSSSTGDATAHEQPENNIEVGTKLVVSGWGSISEGGATSSTLRDVTVPVISNEECSTKYKRTGIKITQNMLCAAYPNGGKDSCQGDSGGPLMHRCSSDDAFSLVGIVSFGIGCARKNYPGVYTRMSSVVQWVQQAINISTTSSSLPLGGGGAGRNTCHSACSANQHLVVEEVEPTEESSSSSPNSTSSPSSPLVTSSVASNFTKDKPRNDDDADDWFD